MKNSSVENASMEHSPDFDIFPFVCLAVGMVIDASRTRFFSHKPFSIPSTVFLLLVSCLFSSLLHQFLREDDPIMLKIERLTWIEKHPHQIMLILLPILVFESSFRLHAHDFYHHLLMILSLAIIGFVLSVLILGAFMWTMMGVVGEMRGWDFLASFTYGTLISATDPVAVVALLDELGAPSVLHVLVDGEALVNDGAAIIAFKLFEAGLKEAGGENEVDWFKKGGELLTGVLLSVIIGYLVARVVVWILVHALKDVTKEQGLVVLSVFFVFIVCENIPGLGIEGSGVLGLVFFGVTLSGRKEHINPRTVEECLHLWEFLAYWANSVVFILTGLWIGKYLTSSDDGDENEDTPGKLWWAGGLLAYIFSLIARLIVTCTIFGVRRLMQLNLKKPHFSWSYIFMMFWAGLRGAVALLLAIQLKIDRIDKTVQHFTLIFVGISVLLSLLLQGGSYEQLAKITGLNDRSAFVKKRMAQRLWQLKNHKAKKLFLSLQMDHKYYYLAESHWTRIWHILAECLSPKGRKMRNSMAVDHSMERTISLERTKTEESSEVEARSSDARDAEPVPAPFTKKLPREAASPINAWDTVLTGNEALDSYLHLVKSRITHMWEQRLFSGRTVRRLSNAIDVAIDRGRLPDVGHFVGEPSSHGLLRCMGKLSKYIPKIDREYPRSHDWWRIGTFFINVVMTFLVLVALFEPSRRHGIYFVIFFISLYLIVEQIALVSRNLSNLKTAGPGCVHFFVRVFLCLDVVYIFIDGAVAVIAGHALNNEKCFHRQSGDSHAFRVEVPYCNRSLHVIVGVTCLRTVIKLPFAIFLVAQLALEHLDTYLMTSGFMSRVSVLTAIIRICEDVGYGLLAKVIPGQENLLEACHYNRILKKSAEAALTEALSEDDQQIYICRLIQTRQAGLILLNKLCDEIDSMEMEGILSQEEHKELDKRMQKGFSKINRFSTQKPMPVPLLEHQVLRINWLQYGKKRDKRNLYLFLITPGVLQAETAQSKDGNYERGHVFFKEGDKSDGIYFLVSGLVQFHRVNPLPYGEINQVIHSGSFFGERSVLGADLDQRNEGRFGTVTAVTKVFAVFMADVYIQDLMTRFPYIGGLMGLELSITMVREVISQYKPYAEMKPDEVNQWLRDHLFKSRKHFKETVTVGKHIFVLAGVLKVDDSFDEEEVIIVHRGQKPVQLEPGTVFSLAPVSDEEPGYFVPVLDLREENMVNKSIYV